MTKPLEPEVKRLRSLAPGELADEAGAAHAALARIKEEAIRRNLRRIDGALFRLTLSEPGRHMRLDRKRLEQVYGAKVIALYCFEVATDWVMRCTARKSA
jgi:hypothetical protein